MYTPQLNQSVTSAPPAPACRHQRLVDRILTEKGKDTGKVRCLECGEIITDQTPLAVQ